MVFFKRIRPPSTKMSKPILSCHPITTKDWLHTDLSLKMNDKNTCFCCCFRCCSSNIYDVYIAEYFYVLIPKMDVVFIHFHLNKAKKGPFFVSLLILFDLYIFAIISSKFSLYKKHSFFSHYLFFFIWSLHEHPFSKGNNFFSAKRQS